MMQRAAFTLIELTIVIVIIGLLAGGVLVGRDLVRASERDSLLADVRRYSSAVSAFHEKYNWFPGDMPNAVTFWGALAGGTANGVTSTCLAVPSTTSSTATCNGAGDGQVDSGGGGADANFFWKHLNNAGIISGNFYGANGSPDYTMLPMSRINGLYWWSYYIGPNLASVSLFGGDYGHVFITQASTTKLTPSDALSLDSKADDGLPASGSIIGFKGTVLPSSPCTSNAGMASDANATYLTSNNNLVCKLYFVKAY